jgi:hypothetical protein
VGRSLLRIGDASDQRCINFSTFKEEHTMASSNQGGSKGGSSGGTRGGTPEQHSEAGRPGHKNDDKGSQAKSSGSGSGSKGTQGGTSEQHSAAGRQSHKNDK